MSKFPGDDDNDGVGDPVCKLLLNAFTKAKLEYYTSMACGRKMGT